IGSRADRLPGWGRSVPAAAGNASPDARVRSIFTGRTAAGSAARPLYTVAASSQVRLHPGLLPFSLTSGAHSSAGNDAPRGKLPRGWGTARGEWDETARAALGCRHPSAARSVDGVSTGLVGRRV